MTTASHLVLLLALGVALGALAHALAVRRNALVVHGRRLDLALSPAEAQAAAEACFPADTWTPIEGDGLLNRAHHLPGRPAISVEVVSAPGGSEVHVWMSGWTLLLGVVRHSGEALAQFDVVESALLTAAEAAAKVEPRVAAFEAAATDGAPGLDFSTEVVRTIHALSARTTHPAREHVAA